MVSAISAKSGWFPVPKFIFDPIDMIGDSAVPMILMAFGMSLHGTKPLQQKGDRPAILTVAVLKNIIMPIIAFLLAYFVMGFRGSELYACVVLAALPTGQLQRGPHLRARRHSDEHHDQPGVYRDHRGAAVVMGAQRSVLNSIRARKCTDIAQTNICSSAYLR